MAFAGHLESALFPLTSYPLRLARPRRSAGSRCVRRRDKSDGCSWQTRALTVEVKRRMAYEGGTLAVRKHEPAPLGNRTAVNCRSLARNSNGLPEVVPLERQFCSQPIGLLIGGQHAGEDILPKLAAAQRKHYDALLSLRGAGDVVRANLVRIARDCVRATDATMERFFATVLLPSCADDVDDTIFLLQAFAQMAIEDDRRGGGRVRTNEAGAR